MKFSVPYNGEEYYIEKISNSSLLPFVSEIYFAGNPLIMGSGRRPKIRDFIVQHKGLIKFDDVKYDDEINRLIKFCVNHKIKCNLLMNFDNVLSNVASSYVSSLIDKGVSNVTVGSLDLLKQVKNTWSDQIDIQNSVYMEVLSLNNIKDIIASGVSIFLLPPEFNSNLSTIENIYKILKVYENVKFKIMVNEGCINYCPHRKQDQLDAQEYKVEFAIQDYLNGTENNRVLSHPCRAHMNNRGINRTNFIHPNDIRKYEKFDPILKIVGRSFDMEKISLIIKSYLACKYNGDLRLIIENFKHSQSAMYYNTSCKTNFLLEI